MADLAGGALGALFMIPLSITLAFGAWEIHYWYVDTLGACDQYCERKH